MTRRLLIAGAGLSASSGLGSVRGVRTRGGVGAQTPPPRPVARGAPKSPAAGAAGAAAVKTKHGGIVSPGAHCPDGTPPNLP